MNRFDVRSQKVKRSSGSWLILWAVPITLGVLVLLLVGCAPAQAAGCPPIKIGVIYSSANPTEMQAQKAGFEAALKDINGFSSGEQASGSTTVPAAQGIGCPIELVNPPAAQAATAEDPQRDLQYLAGQGVVAVVAPFDNAGAKRMARISRFFSMPVVIPGFTGDEIVEASTAPWNFRISPSGQSEAQAFFDLVKANRSALALSAGIFFEQTEYGESAAVQAGEAALRAGIPISVYQRFSPFSEDYKEIQSAITVKKPSIIYLVSTQFKQATGMMEMISTLQKTSTSPLSSYLVGMGGAFSTRGLFYDGAGNALARGANLIFSVPWAANSGRQADTRCNAAGITPGNPSAADNPTLTTVQAEISLRLIASALERTSRAGPWSINNRSVTDWKEILRGAETQSVFRQTLAASLRATTGCRWGNYLWPVDFGTDGQNLVTPLLLQSSGGKWVMVSPKP